MKLARYDIEARVRHLSTGNVGFVTASWHDGDEWRYYLRVGYDVWSTPESALAPAPIKKRELRIVDIAEENEDAIS